MPTDRPSITVSDLVRRAAAIVDPGGDDPAVEELLRLAARAEFDGNPPETVTAWVDTRAG